LLRINAKTASMQTHWFLTLVAMLTTAPGEPNCASEVIETTRNLPVVAPAFGTGRKRGMCPMVRRPHHHVNSLPVFHRLRLARRSRRDSLPKEAMQRFQPHASTAEPRKQHKLAGPDHSGAFFDECSLNHG